jgi:hypothetical protein
LHFFQLFGQILYTKKVYYANISSKINKANNLFYNKIRNHDFEIKPRRLLTLDEYSIQRDRFTKDSLDKLKEFCKSSDCNVWQLLCRLKYQENFINFMNEAV